MIHIRRFFPSSLPNLGTYAPSRQLRKSISASFLSLFCDTGTTLETMPSVLFVVFILPLLPCAFSPPARGERWASIAAYGLGRKSLFDKAGSPAIRLTSRGENSTAFLSVAEGHLLSLAQHSVVCAVP